MSARVNKTWNKFKRLKSFSCAKIISLSVKALTKVYVRSCTKNLWKNLGFIGGTCTRNSEREQNENAMVVWRLIIRQSLIFDIECI